MDELIAAMAARTDVAHYACECGFGDTFDPHDPEQVQQILDHAFYDHPSRRDVFAFKAERVATYADLVG